MAVKRLAAKGFASKKLTLKLTASRILSNKKPSYVAAVAAAVSAAAVSADPYFRYTSLLLTGTGNNNATNNTFLDSSTNNFTITRNGNTTQGAFSPYYGINWSNYFDGTGDFLTVPNNAVFDLAAGNFTVECWINTTGTDRYICTKNTDINVNYGGLTFWVSTTGKLVFLCNPNSGNDTGRITLTSTTSVNTGSWTHCAATRSGNSWYLFVNGVLEATGTSSVSFWSGSYPLRIGAILSYGSEINTFIGHISNFRWIKGTAVYTAAFTPPTAPLTAIANTSLLTCADNRFIDNSTNNFAITTAGNVTVQRLTSGPFAPTETYSASTIGGSAYFDGTGDYLTVPTTTALSFGTGDFTVECWVYKTVAENASIIDTRVNPGGATPWALYVDGSNFPYFYDATVYTSSVAITLNAWVHIAVTRASGTLKIFVNGVQGFSATVTTNLDRTAGAFIGVVANTAAPSAYWKGYISNLRIVKDTAVYTANFTPPTAPLTAITNTALLLNFTNAGIYDNAMLNNVETIGDAKISTTQSKYSGSSMFFDGTGDRLTIPSNSSLNLTGDFTIEMWVYLTTLSAYQMLFSVSNTGGVGAGLTDFYVESNGTISYYASGSTILTSASGALGTNNWYHVALVKNGTSQVLYVNGVSKASATSSTLPNSGVAWTIGDRITGAVSLNYPITGYIDDFRVTKGLARYTANFTPPTAALPTINSTTPTPTVEYLVVAGGGGGGYTGGGGAGGYRTASAFSVSSGSAITVTVGAGGSGSAAGGANNGVSGSNSVFGSITSAGGGYGGNPGISGGSGGGTNYGASQSVATTGGSGNTPPTSPSQGNNGGGGLNGSADGAGGGGGGSSAVGANAGPVGVSPKGGNGGVGTSSSISGTATFYAGGGGGGGYVSSSAGDGGAGGGGGGGSGSATQGVGGSNNGANGTSTVGGTGGANSGGGGGGGAYSGGHKGGGNGGSGIVVIRYSDAYSLATATTGSPTLTIANSYIIYKFTSSGTITF